LSAAAIPQRRNRFPLGTILTSGLVVGILDLAYVIVLWVLVLKKTTVVRICQSIAAGLLGKAAYEGGTQTAVLGLACHFAIATIWSLVFYVWLRNSSWLRRQMSTPGRVVSTGMIYGVGVWLLMDFVVLTLSRARMTPVSSWPFWVNMCSRG
jgi:hypothetical protein